MRSEGMVRGRKGEQRRMDLSFHFISFFFFFLLCLMSESASGSSEYIHVFRNHSDAQFVSFSAFRISKKSLAVSGLSAFGGPFNNSKEYFLPRSCAWIDQQNQTATNGTLLFRPAEESTTEGKAYGPANLFCYLKGKRPPRITTGHLVMTVGNYSFIPYRERKPIKKPKLKYDLVFCGPSLWVPPQPESISQWIDYHLYHVGYQHIQAYNAGGFDAALKQAVQKHINLRILKIVEFEDHKLYPSRYFGQTLAMNDCMLDFRNRANWVAFGDFDEYMFLNLPPPATVKGFLSEKLKQEIPWVSHGGFYVTPYCKENIWQSKDEKFAVEDLVYRLKDTDCHQWFGPFDWQLCPDHAGRRKTIVHPPKIEVVQIHRVWRTPPLTKPGIHLRVDTEIGHGHYYKIMDRCITGEECCKVIHKHPPPDLGESIFKYEAIARVAASARRCFLNTTATYQSCFKTWA